VVGFVAFLATAALFTIFFVRDIYSLANLLFFVLPILLVAFLFYIDWKWLKPQSPAQTDAAA
jgi:threonine/homoserine/homoserine lactone efflux protein